MEPADIFTRARAREREKEREREFRNQLAIIDSFRDDLCSQLLRDSRLFIAARRPACPLSLSLFLSLSLSLSLSSTPDQGGSIVGARARARDAFKTVVVFMHGLKFVYRPVGRGVCVAPPPCFVACNGCTFIFLLPCHEK